MCLWGSISGNHEGQPDTRRLSSPGSSSWIQLGLVATQALGSAGPSAGGGEAITSQHCPPWVHHLRFLPLLLCRYVQGIHDETHRFRNLLGPDCVLLEFGLHCRLGDALLGQTRGAEEAEATRVHQPRPKLWRSPPGTRLVGAGEAQNNQIPESKGSPQISFQNSETQTSSLGSLLQERPLGELHHVSPEVTGARDEIPQSQADRAQGLKQWPRSKELLAQGSSYCLTLRTSF